MNNWTIDIITVFASQALGVAACPSICASMAKQAVESALPPCHQTAETEKEMPLDCSVASFLKDISTYNLTSFSIDLEKKSYADDLYVAALPKVASFKYSIDTSNQYFIGKSPPLRKYPVYLLQEKFLI